MAVMGEDSRSDLEHAVSGIRLEQYLHKTASCPNPRASFWEGETKHNPLEVCHAEDRSLSVVQHPS